MKNTPHGPTGASSEPTMLKIWKTLAIGSISKEQLVAEIKKKANINDWALDAINQKSFICQNNKEYIYLILITPRQFGFTEEPLLCEMYARVLSVYLKLCPIQTGLDLRLSYTDQPIDQKIRIGMELVKDSDGSEHQFYLENTATHGLSLGSNWITATNRCKLDELWLFRSLVLFEFRRLEFNK